MKLFFYGLLMAVVNSETTINPILLDAIFNNPLPSSAANEDVGSTFVPPARTGSGTTNDFGFVFEKPQPTAPSSTIEIDKNVLYNIFKNPYTPGPMTVNTVTEKVVETFTEGNTILVQKHKTCNGYCMPYYLCNSTKVEPNVINADSDNVITSGYGQLDVRLGEDEVRQCYTSVDVCCSEPWDTEKPKTQLMPIKARKCGYRNPKGVGATFTNADTQFGEFPWVIAVLDADTWTYLGVGVLISPQVVMTVAHIASSYTSGDLKLKIRAGEWDTQTQNEIFPFQERIVKEIYIHEDYDKVDRRSNNIALLRFEQPLELSEYVNAICMPEQDQVFDNYKSCIANGWGKTTFGLKGRFAVILKKVELNVVPYSRCSILLRNTRLGSRFRLHQSFLCAGGKEGEDTCEGDGGAPLACPIGDNRYQLTGLVAWGVGCGEKDVPGVYTNVPMFREWVDKKMADWGLSTASYSI